VGIPIQDGGLIATRLQRLLRTQGRLAPELEEFVLPVIQVANLSEGGAPPVSRSAVMNTTLGAVAGEFGQMRLSAPPGILAVVKKFKFKPNSVLDVLVFFGTSLAVANLPNAHIPSFTDGRLRDSLDTDPSAQILSGNQAAGFVTTNWRYTAQDTPNDDWVYPSTPWVVGTGTQGTTGHLEFQLGTANVAAGVVIEWEEYPLF